MKDEPAIIVSGLHKSFKLPHEKQTSIKGLFVNIFRGRRTFEKQQVLKDVSFEVKKGEFFAIVGRNGGGKSTLLKLLAGIYAPNKGHIHINGKLTPFIELGVGFNPELTGQENVYLNGALLGFSRSEMRAMYPDIVAFAELEKFMDQKLKNYSSGMQVRLAFSIAIRAQSDILLLDEVLAVGDAAFQQKCFDYFEEIKKTDKTVVFVTHDMGAVTRFCTKAIYIKDGQMVKLGSPAAIAKFYKLENLKAVNRSINETGELVAGADQLSAEVTKKSDKNVTIQYSYESDSSKEIYVGLSVMKDGISVAEITTSLDKPLKGSGKVTYNLSLEHFNEGVYQISSVLCQKQGRRLLAVCREPITFAVDSQDQTRGSALKLEDNWKY